MAEVALAHEHGARLDLELLARAGESHALVGSEGLEERDSVEVGSVHRDDASVKAGGPT